jgi:hypothetical protein
MTTEDGVPETEGEIQERIDDIISDIDCLSMDTELSPAEILGRVALTMIRGCDGGNKFESVDEERAAIREFFEAIAQKAVA